MRCGAGRKERVGCRKTGTHVTISEIDRQWELAI